MPEGSAPAPAPAPAAASAKAPPAGDATQKAFFASELGLATRRAVARESQPRMGESRVTFSSAHAAALPVQLAALFRRGMRSYERNVGLNFGRLVALTMLNLLFGTIWFGIAACTADRTRHQPLPSH